MGLEVILKFLELEIKWPKDVLVEDLRVLIIEHLEKYGDPLRWAITFVSAFDAKGDFRELKLEAVVVRSNYMQENKL